MVIAVIFAGIFGFFGDLTVRGWDFPYGWSPRAKREAPQGRVPSEQRRRRGSWDAADGGGGGAILAIIVALAIIRSPGASRP